MKRILLKLPMEYVYRKGFKKSMDYIAKLDVIDILNFYQCSMTVLEHITFKDPKFTPQDLIGIDGMKYIEVISHNKRENEYLCNVHLENPDCFSEYFSKYNIMVSKPILIIDDWLFIPYLSYGKNITKIYEKISKQIGDNYSIVRITDYSLDKDNLYSLLTGRQLEIALHAASKGYFNNPKKVSTSELAKTFNITPAAFTEHIRKIKANIFKNLF